MAEPLMNDAELVRRLGLHPEPRSQIESLVLAVQDETGELKTVDAAEMRVIEVIRRRSDQTLRLRPVVVSSLNLTQYCQVLSGLNRIVYEVRQDTLYIHVIVDSRRNLSSCLLRRLVR